MKKSFLFLFLALAICCASLPVFAANKDMIQLQTQVQALQEQMARMQQSFDERMGVMRNLVEQTTDNVNKMSVSVDNLNKSLQQQNADAAGRLDQVSGQVDRPDGSWLYKYSPEGRQGKMDMGLATNRALLRNREDGVPVGTLDPEAVVTPGIFVQRVVAVPRH